MPGRPRRLPRRFRRSRSWTSRQSQRERTFLARRCALSGNRFIAGAVTTAEGDIEAAFWRSGTLERLGTLGGSTSSAHGINRAGDIVGESLISGDAASRAFVTDRNGMLDLGTLGGASSWGRDIDDRGVVVGGAELPNGLVHAFIWRGGEMRDLGTLGGASSFGEAIGANGDAVGGAALAGDTSTHAVLWDDRGITDLGTLGGSFSTARDISEGDVVGWADTSGDESHAFRWRDGAMVDLGTLGGRFSAANGVNRDGAVVGVSTIAGDIESRGFLVVGEQMFELDERLSNGAGWSMTEAFAIDDNGRIAAQATLAGQTHAVLLVPEHGRPRAD